MNRRKKNKQTWLQFIGGDYRAYKILQRKRYEETIAFKKKYRAGHLTEDDIDNFWMKDLNIYPEYIEQMCSKKRAPRGSKTAVKKMLKALAYCNLKR